MKTAVSLPDELFAEGERLAAQLGVPRSQLYATALKEYIHRHGSEHVTALLDAVYTDEESHLDPVISALQATALAESESS